MVVALIFDAWSRIPGHLAGNSFFGHEDQWMFILGRSPNHCTSCKEMDGSLWRGDQLRSTFPYLEIWDENTIMVYLHPHCTCFLQRISGFEEFAN